MKTWRLFIMGFFASLFGCSGPKPPVLPDILSEAEDGFMDMVFAVTKHDKTPSGEVVIEMASNTDSGEVALRMILGADWAEGTVGGEMTTYQGTVTACRIDGRSDLFVQFVDKAYGTGLKPSGMTDAVEFTGISLEGNPNAPSKGLIKIKLFFESEEEKEYAEAYLNLDLAHQKAWFKEKDPEFRAALVTDMMK